LRKESVRSSISIRKPSKEKWIELEPVGICPPADFSRPMVLFREVGGERVLPVWVSHLEAGISLIQHQGESASPSPHEFTRQLLEQLNVEITTCSFDEVVGHHQFVSLGLKGTRKIKNMKARADHVVSLCLHAGCTFFTTPKVLKLSQTLEQQMSEAVHSVKLMPQDFKNPHPYLN